MKKTSRFFAILVICCPLTLFAADRSFPGIDIVTRAQRGANEARRYFSEAGYTNRVKKNEAYEQRLSGGKTDLDDAFAQRKAREEITTKREDFLKANYPDDILTDFTTRKDGTKRLLRPLSYKKAKKKIVIHHTATNERWTSPARILSGIQEIYKQHTIVNQRGDIGYNFLIDPLGKVYEGRAGGADVVGAHADRNNVSTIGIALMGNFNIHHPSLHMRWSLQKLVLAVMLEYGIDPNDTQSYFTPVDQDPWLEVHTHTSLVGHNETKNTACPGDDIKSRLPGLRDELSKIYYVLHSRKDASLSRFRFSQIPLRIWMQNDRVTTTYPFANRVVRSCELIGDGIQLVRCGGNGRDLIVEIERNSPTPSGRYPLLVETDAGAVWVDLQVVRAPQMDKLLEQRKEAANVAPVDVEVEKIEKKITVPEITALMNKKIGVLLYEPTTQLSNRELMCESTCTVELDNKSFSKVKFIHAQPSLTASGQLDVFVDLKKYSSSSVQILNPSSVVTITNFSRGSSSYPLNYFKGDISISYQPYTTADKKQKNGWTVVNQVGIDDYLHGIAETVETQHPEKLRVMALLTKGYILYYAGGNRHPSIASGVNYVAIDDPRLFQKYVGAGREQASPKRQQALETMHDKVVVYDGYLPILPYFHCSAGFTWSGVEKRGRKDTPWLQSKLDPGRCVSGEFEGHGVGLSGEGAEIFARAGVKAEKILGRYYDGVKIVKVN